MMVPQRRVDYKPRTVNLKGINSTYRNYISIKHCKIIQAVIQITSSSPPHLPRRPLLSQAGVPTPAGKATRPQLQASGPPRAQPAGTLLVLTHARPGPGAPATADPSASLVHATSTPTQVHPLSCPEPVAPHLISCVL